MKSRLGVSIVISILIASVLAASYMGYATVFAKPTHSFALRVSGTAYDTHNHGYVNVDISVIGTADGKLKMVIDLDVKGGDVKIQDITFSVSRGCGELVWRCAYIELSIRLTPKYGGKTTLWCMSGKTGTLSNQALQVSLHSSHVIPPITSYPRLDNLSLKGTITPIY